MGVHSGASSQTTRPQSWREPGKRPLQQSAISSFQVPIGLSPSKLASGSLGRWVPATLSPSVQRSEVDASSSSLTSNWVGTSKHPLV